MLPVVGIGFGPGLLFGFAATCVARMKTGPAKPFRPGPCLLAGLLTAGFLELPSAWIWLKRLPTPQAFLLGDDHGEIPPALSVAGVERQWEGERKKALQQPQRLLQGGRPP